MRAHDSLLWLILTNHETGSKYSVICHRWSMLCSCVWLPIKKPGYYECDIDRSSSLWFLFVAGIISADSFDSWCRFLQNCESPLRSQQKDFYIWNNYIVQSIWNTFSVSELQLSTYILLYGSRSWYSIKMVLLQLSSNRQ